MAFMRQGCVGAECMASCLQEPQTQGKQKMIKMLRAPRVEPPFGAQAMIGRAAPALGWIGLGALAASATAWVLLRSGRRPSNGQEPNGQEPDVLLDVSELEVDRINLEVEDLRAHVSILVELANL